MGSGGGSDPISDVIEGAKGVVEDVRNDPVNAAVNWLTGGLVGYDSEKGGFSKGVWTQAGDEAIGELSGRNMQRKAQMEAKDAIAVEKEEKKKEIKNEQVKKQRADVNASVFAGQVRRTAAAKSNRSLGSQEQDFLGL